MFLFGLNQLTLTLYVLFVLCHVHDNNFFQFLYIPIYNSIVVQCGVFDCVSELFVEVLCFICVGLGMEFVESIGIVLCLF